MNTMFRAASILCAALTMIPAANATCNPGKLFTTWDFTDIVYYYVHFGPDSMESTDYTVGAFWEPGNRALSNEGTCDDSSWLRYYEPTGKWYVSGSLGDACSTGCPSGGMNIVITDDKGASGADFAVGRADETPAQAAHFNFGDFNLTPLPRPRVMSSHREGRFLYLDIYFEDLSAGFNSRFGHADTSVITGINLYTSPEEDPGRSAADWVFHSTASYEGGRTELHGIEFDCEGLYHLYLSAGLQMDDGDYDTVHVSAATRAECQILADPDPDDKFDIIKTRGKGKKKGRPFRE
jgi:hypothetical protein